MYWILLIIAIIGIDQATKIYIFSEQGKFANIPIIKDFFYITYCENRGAAFSMLQNFRWVFIALTVIAVAVMIKFLVKYKHPLLRVSLSLLIAGALGNMIDRALRGFVVDFLHFYPFGYDFPIFNAADVSINIGVALLLIYLVFIYKDPAKGKTSAKDGKASAADTASGEDSTHEPAPSDDGKSIREDGSDAPKPVKESE